MEGEIVTNSEVDRSSPRWGQWVVDRIYLGLEITDALFGQLGIPYTMIGGTLLGAIRHGGLIPWDADADVSIRQRDMPELLAWAKPFLQDRSFDLGYASYRMLKIFPRDGYQPHQYSSYRSPAVDIFPLVEETPDRWNHVTAEARRDYPGDFFEGLSFGCLHRYDFGSLRLSGPSDPVARRYLTSTYGPTWPTEAHFWDRNASGQAEERIFQLAAKDLRPALPSPQVAADTPALRSLFASRLPDDLPRADGRTGG